MPYQNYRDLTVWQKAMDLTDEVYRLTRMLPKEELYSLSDQMRRAAVSIPSNIAEGRGRQTDKDFRSFLSIANGSCMELETQLLICVRQGFLTQANIQTALSLSNEVNRMLSSMIIRLSSPHTDV